MANEQDDIGSCSREEEIQIESFRQRRAAIDARVEEMKTDLDAINERRRSQGKQPVEMSFDFADQPAGS